jgi:hypothetical protein
MGSIRASRDSAPRRSRGVAHEHLVQLILAHARLAQRGQDVVGDVVVVPLRPLRTLASSDSMSDQQLASCESTIFGA